MYNLKLSGDSQPIGVTATHPFWSVDRSCWVSAMDLRIGEMLKTPEDTMVVEGWSKRESPETVYNIEVNGDHVYRTTNQGVLVHNASIKGNTRECARAKREAPSWDEDSPGDAFDYQRRVCRRRVYQLTSRVASVRADGIDGCTLLECKYVKDPTNSAQTGTASAWWIERFGDQEVNEVERYAKLISDPCTPWDKLKIKVNHPDAVAYWRQVVQQFSINSRVIHRR